MNNLIKHVLFIVIGLVQFANCQAQEEHVKPNAFDLVPEDFLLAVVTPTIGELEPKLFKLAQQISPDEDFPPEDNFAKYFYEFAGFDLSVSNFDEILDRSRGGGIVMYSNYGPISVLPVKNIRKLAEYLEVNLKALESGVVVRTAQKNSVVYKDGNLYVFSETFFEANRDLEEVTDLPRFRSRISDENQKRLLTSDAIVLIDSQTYRFLKMFQPSLSLANLALTKDEADEGFVALMKKADKSLDYVTMGVKLDGGIHIESTMHFDETAQDEIGSLIESVRGGDEPSNLDSLPDSQVVAAFGAKGTGAQNVSAAKSLLAIILKRVSPDKEILSEKDKVVFYESFSKLWKQMNGTRVGVYRLEEPKDPAEHAEWAEKGTGRLGAVTIFDVDDPQAFLDELPALVKFANDSAELNTAIEETLAINFHYEKSVSTIAGYSVDELVIDTDRLTPEARDRFRYLFGNDARRLKWVAMNNHLLMYVGTSTKRLEETIANLEAGKKGLSQHPAILKNADQIDPNRKIEFHFSASNLYDIYNFEDNLNDYSPVDELSAISFTLDVDRLGFDTWIPAKEIEQFMRIVFE